MSAVLALLMMLSLLTPGPARTILIDDCLSAGSVASPVASPESVRPDIAHRVDRCGTEGERIGSIRDRAR